MNNFIKGHTNICVFIFYIILTLIFTVPVIFNFTTHIPAPGGDAFEILAYPYQETNNWFSLSTGYQKITYFLNYLNPRALTNRLVQLFFLHQIFNEPLAYNIQWMSSFVLSAFGVFLLVKYLVKNNIAAFLSGIIYSFSPFHFLHQFGHTGAGHIEWLPFFVLFLIKYFNKPSLKNIFLTSLFFLFIVSNEPHYVFSTLIFIIIFFVYYLITKKELVKNKKFIIYTSIFGVIGIIFLVLSHLHLLSIAISENNFLNPGLDDAIKYSADLIGIIVPSDIHPLWGGFFRDQILSEFTGNSSEYTIYVGFVVLFFGFFSLGYLKKYKEIKFWIFAAFLFFIFSLGPYLHIFGKVTFIPLPSFFLYKFIPFVENMRAFGRMFIISQLSLSVLAGFGISFFLTKLNNEADPQASLGVSGRLFYERLRLRRFNFKSPSSKKLASGYSGKHNKIKSRIVLPLIIFLITIIELWGVPFVSDIKVPQFYKDLAKESKNYKVLPIPIDDYVFSKYALYYGAIANKKIVGEEYSRARLTPEDWELERNTFPINILVFRSEFESYLDGELDVKQNSPQRNSEILKENHIKYITIHKNQVEYAPIKGESTYLSFKRYIFLKKFIENYVDIEKVYEDEEMIAYLVR